MKHLASTSFSGPRGFCFARLWTMALAYSLLIWALLIGTLAWSSPAAAQKGDPQAPYQAFDEGRFDEAVEGFTELQVRYPDDPEIVLNLAASHYELQSYPEADAFFRRAASVGVNPQQLTPQERDLRARALYGLGNSAYRQGRLDEAVEHYRQALEMNPDDEDTKFNLEFVRDEIRRRHEENQQRQQSSEDQQNQDQDGEGEQQDGSQGDSSGQNQDQNQQQQDQDPNQDQGQNQDQNQDQSQDQGQNQDSGSGEGQDQPQDQDGDGLPDDTESRGTNPTDPQNPDTDGDGIPDGQEDADRDGRRDPGETDPNLADSDGDGIPDGQDPTPSPEDSEPQSNAENSPSESEGSPPQGESPQGGATTGQSAAEGVPEGLTPEEAARYLMGLEEGRPQRKAPPSNRRGRPAKDW
ncbi:MAG: tetratricopeptide repeat protein [Acidobacteriota bacterium]